ncbi:FAD-dependent oxidoreductase [Salinicoccus sp. HZC-1]|uniref:FAD-dependent oxidoreductase n=1 Tax=Salinicoccus sp. HZC-1 TaxID=3385497 RepID=UPI00398A58BD
MSEFKNENISFWSDSVELPSFSALEKDIETDVLVVGGGISGLMNAYQLAMRGHEVTVIEGNTVLSGTTAHTTARIMAQQGLLYGQISKQKDKDSARLYYDSQMEAIDEIESIVNKHDIDCDFRRVDGVIYAVYEDSIKDLEKEAEVYNDIGIDGALFKNELTLPFETKAELVMRNQAEYHPLKFLNGILEVLKEKGVKVYEETRGESADDDTLTTTEGINIKFNTLVIATHFPFLDFDGLYFNSFKISYGYGLVVTSSTPPSENLSLNGYDGASLSTRNIMNPNREQPTILYGGMGHMSYEMKDMTEQLKKLKLYADQKTTNEETLYAYRAQDLMTADSLPFIGHFDREHNNRFVATGFNKYGMTNGVLSSMIISDLIEGNNNRYTDLLSPHRNKGTFQQLKQHISNPMHVAESEAKNMMKQHPDITEVELDAGQGKVVSDGVTKKGVYRDEDACYVVDNRCTHMGCSLGWNQDDKTWDCPCHGSRFNYKGEVIEGPAVENLDSEIKNLKE